MVCHKIGHCSRRDRCCPMSSHAWLNHENEFIDWNGSGRGILWRTHVAISDTSLHLYPRVNFHVNRFAIENDECESINQPVMKWKVKAIDWKLFAWTMIVLVISIRLTLMRIHSRWCDVERTSNDWLNIIFLFHQHWAALNAVEWSASLYNMDMTVIACMLMLMRFDVDLIHWPYFVHTTPSGRQIFIYYSYSHAILRVHTVHALNFIVIINMLPIFHSHSHQLK